MVRVEELSKTFGKTQAVRSVNFEVETGQTLVLLGTSGSGKTTTLKMINRLIEPSAGKIFINGQDALHQKPEILRQNIGYVIQNGGLFPHYTVLQNIGIVPKLQKWDKQRIRQRAEELLNMLGLKPEDYLHRYPNELSGGQQQRIGIARALAVEPEIMLLDEPFGALDPITRHQIQQEFLQLESLRNKTVLMVSHDVFEAFEMGDLIALMDKGELQQIGKPEELIFNPKNTFVERFFAPTRFELGLRVRRLADLWHHIQVAELPSALKPEKLPQFKLKENLWNVLQETAKDPQNQNFFAVSTQDNQLAYSNTQAVLKAL